MKKRLSHFNPFQSQTPKGASGPAILQAHNKAQKSPLGDLGANRRLSALITILAFLLLNIASVSAQRQIFPISVTTQLTPPYSVALADYAAPGCEQLKVFVTQRDLTQAPYRIRLKMEIKLNGRVILRTSTTYTPPPLTMQPGIPTVISGTDLYPFLDPRNMDFVGISYDNYMRTKSLPEGAYAITFTAYSYDIPDKVLSDGGTMFCYLAQGQPPRLNLPFNNTGVPALPLQNVVFQWTPGNIASPNSATTTRYRFELFEMRVLDQSPAEITQTTRPIYSVVTERTTFAYTIQNTALQKGIRYAWHVQEFDTRGIDRLANNGYSEVYSFVYGVAEDAPMPGTSIANFEASALSPTRAKFTWDASPEFDGYKVYYRETGGKWYSDETVKNTYELGGLSPDSIYEGKVQGRKGTIWGGFSKTDTTRLPKLVQVACGQGSNAPFVITNRTPLPELHKYSEINNGAGTTVTILEVTGSNGRFSGKGYVTVPLFGNARMRCTFNNILVNTDFQLIEGEIPLISDPKGKSTALWNADDLSEGGRHNGQVNNGTNGVAVKLNDVTIPDAQSITLDTAKQEIVVVTANGDTVRTSVEQQLKTNPPTLTVQDKDGNLYSVNTNTGTATYVGKVPAGTPPTFDATAITNSDAMVTFLPSPDQKYAFDVRNKLYANSTLFSEEYKTLDNNGNTPYDIPIKLIPVGQTDVVIAKPQTAGTSINPDSIVYQSSTGTIFAAQKSDTPGQYLLTLPSGQEKDGIDVYALYPRKTGKYDVLGKITVVTYSVIQPKLILVPVNGNDIDEAAVKSELDKIYLPVAVDWQVSKDSSFSTTVDSLDIKNSGLFSMYTPGMKALNSKFIQQRGTAYDPSALYLFILKYSDDPMATGDMPRSKQFGYIFTETTKTALKGATEMLYRTIAHEIAHGAFHLKHTFDSQYDIARATTQNLMDYTTGLDLVKHEWDAIHDPGLVLGLFETDADGKMDWTDEVSRRLTNTIIGDLLANIGKGNDFDLTAFIKKYGYYPSNLYSYDFPLVANGKSQILVEFSYNKEGNTFYQTKNPISEFVYFNTSEHTAKLNLIFQPKAGATGSLASPLLKISVYTTDDFEKLVQRTGLNSADYVKAISNQIYQKLTTVSTRDEIITCLRYVDGSELPVAKRILYLAKLLSEQQDDLSTSAVVKLLKNFSTNFNIADYFNQLKQNQALVKNCFVFAEKKNLEDILYALTALTLSNWTTDEINSTQQKYFFDFPFLYSPTIISSFSNDFISISCSYVFNNNYVPSVSEKLLFTNTDNKLFTPFSPIKVVYYTQDDNKSYEYTIPAFQFHYLLKLKEESRQTNTPEKKGAWIANIITSIGLVSENLLVRVTSWIGLANSAANKVINLDPIHTELMSSAEGQKFLELWPTISTAVDLTSISVNVLYDFAIASSKVKNLFSKLAKEDADAIEAKLVQATSISGVNINTVDELVNDFLASPGKYDDILQKNYNDLVGEEKRLRDLFEQADEIDVSAYQRDLAYKTLYESKHGGIAKATKNWRTQTIGTDPIQNQIKDKFCSELEKTEGVSDIRVNQTHSLANGKAVGINRPDIQFTFNNKRYYVEIDAASSNRGIPHKNRILVNDPNVANTIPSELQKIVVTINGKTFQLNGGITLIKLQ